jgi:hypothetical protein
LSCPPHQAHPAAQRTISLRATPPVWEKRPESLLRSYALIHNSARLSTLSGWALFRIETIAE